MKKIGVLFGGKSTEHEVSIKSGINIINGFNKERYEITPIYIDKSGEWFYFLDSENFLFDKEKLLKIDNVFKFLKSFDVLFPVLHGKNGEDGTVQGLFEMVGVPYVGCGVLSSAISLDKFYTKIILDRFSIKQAKYICVKKIGKNYVYIDSKFNEKSFSLDPLCNFIDSKFSYPLFVKPANFGSSVGISKVSSKGELSNSLSLAFSFDEKVLVEENVDGIELECAVLGGEEVISSLLGRVVTPSNFYSYDSKYKNNDSELVIPAKVSSFISEEVRSLAIKVFKIVSGRGLARVDFFVDGGDIYVNEVNTMPGFTDISMYPMLFKSSGLELSLVLDKLVSLALM